MSIDQLTFKTTQSAGGIVPRLLRMLRIGFDALTTGARAVPMGDNGALFRDLAMRSSRPSDECIEA